MTPHARSALGEIGVVRGRSRSGRGGGGENEKIKRVLDGCFRGYGAKIQGMGSLENPAF